MSGERTIELSDDPHPEPSSATTSGLATRFVGGGRAGAELATSVPDAQPPEERKWRSRPDEGAPPRDGTKLLRTGLVASTVGLCVLLFVGYVTFFSNLQQHREQHALLNQFTTPSRVQLLSLKAPPEGGPAAVLTIPVIGLSQVVVEGTSATDLLKGPGLMPGTARPGSLGNSVIAGHASIAGSPFARLDSLRRGEAIEVVTARGAYHYQILAVGSVRPGARDPISPSRHPRLTLVTSGGPSAGSGRTYVVAALKGTPNRIPIPRHPPMTAERGLSGDSAAVLPAILWALALAAGLAATFLAYWRFKGRHWSVYLLSTPILLAVSFLWYENLIRLLPGTM
jgi:sortase A